MAVTFEPPDKLAKRLQEDKEALRLDDKTRDEVWERIIAERPELEHAVFDLPDAPWWRRLWRWLTSR